MTVTVTDAETSASTTPAPVLQPDFTRDDLRAYRKALKLRQNAFADSVGISRVHMNRIERGVRAITNPFRQRIRNWQELCAYRRSLEHAQSVRDAYAIDSRERAAASAIVALFETVTKETRA